MKSNGRISSVLIYMCKMPLTFQSDANKEEEKKPPQKKKKKPRTRLEKILMPLNANCGDVNTGWGSILVMLFFILMFVLFLAIILEIYNSSIILANVDIDWEDYI